MENKEDKILRACSYAIGFIAALFIFASLIHWLWE